jgi:hypothetical protein
LSGSICGKLAGSFGAAVSGLPVQTAWTWRLKSFAGVLELELFFLLPQAARSAALPMVIITTTVARQIDIILLGMGD